MNKILRLGVVALATVATCVVMSASPASAATMTALINTGSFTFTNSTGTAADLVPSRSAGSGCTSSATMDLGTTTAQVTALSSIARFQFTTTGTTGTWYVVETTLASSTAGTLTGTTITSAGVVLQLDFYVATSQTATGGCTHGTTRSCQWTNVSAPLSGTYTGNPASPSFSETAKLSGYGTLGATSPPCSAPFTTYNGGTTTVNNLTFHSVDPAPTATTVTAVVDSGGFTFINSTGTVTDFFPSHSAGSGCTSDVTLDFNYPAVQITTFSSNSRFQFTPTSTWYVLEKAYVSSTAGTLTGISTTSATINSNVVTFRLDVYVATDQTATGGCAHGTTRTCRWSNVTMSFLGTYTGNFTSPLTTDTASLSGSGTLGTTTPPCNSPFTTYNGGTITANSLSLDVTAVP